MASKHEARLSLLPADPRAALLASTFGADGMVTPRSRYKGFETYSFPPQTKPSPWATPRICGLLRAYSAVTDGRGQGGTPPKQGQVR